MSKKKIKNGNLLLYFLFLPTLFFIPAIIIFIIIAIKLGKTNQIYRNQILLSQLFSLIPYITFVIFIITKNYYEIIISIILLIFITITIIFEMKKINNLKIKNKSIKIANKVRSSSTVIFIASLSTIISCFLAAIIKSALGTNMNSLYIYFMIILFISVLSHLLIIIASLIIKITKEKEKLYEK